MHPFDSPFGVLHLERYPPDASGRLRAHDGADLLILEEYADLRHRLPARPRVLVLGDQHGALTTALTSVADVTAYGDSELAARAAEANLRAAGRSASVRRGLPVGGDYDVVLARVPKSLGLLAAQLAALSGQLAAGMPFVAGAMTKHLSRGANDVISRYIGDVTPSLGRHKARLLRAAADPSRCADPPQPTTYEVPGRGITLTTLPGAYAGERLDQGARVLLDHLPTGLGSAAVADLGCGNGVLAITSAADNPQAAYTLVDESSQAIESARIGWGAAHPGRDADFALTDGLSDAEPGEYDVVLCNPPFHQGFAVEPAVAQRLLAQAHRALRPGGELYVVGNRHLDHGAFLRRRFASVRELAATPKFTVHVATR
ncbi:methyltransferase [Epidermidibacterium keratini]|uniref:Methyltransferase n=1 Tax=Epidermidibacterium keratini TaxID=1891644 RepID=A0A7L4YR54_9ACTN|nr:class I SAM-dependent methyltransferase [Epidermidibacterium keratini]QHC01423.1 methyltransferase [Epidermidibacterium keratini]